MNTNTNTEISNTNTEKTAAYWVMFDLITAVVECAAYEIARTPVVGEGATVYLYSDRQAFTVIAVSKSGKTCTMQRDTAKLMNGVQSGAADALTFEPGGFCGHTDGVQRYEYARNFDGEIVTARMTKRGWKSEGRSVKFGKRSENYDFNF